MYSNKLFQIQKRFFSKEVTDHDAIMLLLRHMPNGPKQIKVDSIRTSTLFSYQRYTPMLFNKMIHELPSDKKISSFETKYNNNNQLYIQNAYFSPVTPSDEQVENIIVTSQKIWSPNSVKRVLFIGNVQDTQMMIKRISTYCASFNIFIEQIKIDPNNSLTITLDQVKNDIEKDLPLLCKWLDDKVFTMLQKQRFTSLLQAEMFTSLCNLLYCMMGSSEKYTRGRIEMLMLNQFLEVSTMIDQFIRNEPIFKPGSNNEILDIVYNLLFDITHTNIKESNRRALSFRLNPNTVLKYSKTSEKPFAVFFVNGRNFNGFHVRFRPIARGGLRLVTPKTDTLFEYENSRTLQECYDLAYAQQLKNKDIPEGGAKGVCIIDKTKISESEPSSHIVDTCVHSFVDSILDIIQTSKELLFFGPDEQITTDHIKWMISRAEQRSYPLPLTFMTSKPDIGINHKEYGVTSEGVNIFLKEAMKKIGLHTSESFTVKITGGPDGDVAGNMLKILHRDYGNKVKIVGIADGTASIEDPDGIDWNELLRLANQSKPLVCYEANKLGNNSKLYLCSSPEGIAKRNTMHNRVKSDVFIPAGGRPATINDQNWTEFIHEGGKLSSPLIVEGANLFLTEHARTKLSEAGCLIIKDSSANKCGVCCSSMEVLSLMLLTKDEFLSKKTRLVQDVMYILKSIAFRESSLLMNEYVPNESLSKASQRISFAINRAKDAFEQSIDDEKLSILKPVLSMYIPKTLQENADLIHQIPLPYLKRMLSTIVATEFVYKEGLAFASSIPDNKIADTLYAYYTVSRHVHKIHKQLLDKKDIDDSDRAILSNVLIKCGPRSLLK